MLGQKLYTLGEKGKEVLQCNRQYIFIDYKLVTAQVEQDFYMIPDELMSCIATFTSDIILNNETNIVLPSEKKLPVTHF